MYLKRVGMITLACASFWQVLALILYTLYTLITLPLQPAFILILTKYSYTSSSTKISYLSNNDLFQSNRPCQVVGMCIRDRRSLRSSRCSVEPFRGRNPSRRRSRWRRRVPRHQAWLPVGEQRNPNRHLRLDQGGHS